MKDLPPDLIDVIVKEAMKSGEIAMGQVTQGLLPVIKVDVPFFLAMHPDEMKRDIFYPVYIRAAQAIARRPTIDLLVEVLQYQKSGGASAGSTMRIPEAIREARVRIMLDWYHMCPYRFHDLVDILYSSSSDKKPGSQRDE